MQRQNLLAQVAGQMAVEYILLIVIIVAIAGIVLSQMVSRDPTNPGFLIQTWSGIITAIGADSADDVKASQ